MPPPAGHDLVVGGSGMLAELCQALARTGRRVSVLARDPRRLARLAASTPGILPLPADYTDAEVLERTLREASLKSGPIDRAVCWIHETAPHAPLAIASHIGRVYCHVLGSAVANPGDPSELARWRQAFSARPNLDYRIAVLGFMRNARGSRWLTDDQICAGVGRALETGGPVSIVGVVEPWSERP